MRFAASREHKKFFREHCFIEFSELLSPAAVEELLQAVLTSRKAVRGDADKTFIAGRDLWRNEPKLSKVSLASKFAEVFADLVDQKPIRMGFDQILSVEGSSDQEDRPRFFEGELNLFESCSFGGLLGGLVLRLSGKGEELENGGICPMEPGDGVFFYGGVPQDFSALFAHGSADYLFIFYGGDSVQYIFREKDPHCHYLKQLGYGFGDSMSDRTHPILFR